MTLTQRFTSSRNAKIAVVAVITLLIVSLGVWWLRHEEKREIVGYFDNAVALFEDNEVRMLGVKVGDVTDVDPQGTVVRVTMEVDEDLKLPADVKAVIVSPSLVTGRYVQLTPVYRTGPLLPEGAEIPRERTEVPLEVDDLFRTADELARLLGPDGANSDGALSDALRVGAENLDGRGRQFNDTLQNLGRLTGTLSQSRDDLFGTVRELQSFVSTIAGSDDQVRALNSRLADVNSFLADERGNLGAALSELSVALGEVSAFVQDNRAALKGSADKLADVTRVVAGQQGALAEVLDTAPAGLNNLANVYDGASGTLGVRTTINELASPPIITICELLRRGTPQGLPTSVSDLCAAVDPLITGQVQLPNVAQVLTTLRTGELPFVPGLALPTVPGPGDR